MIARSSSIRYTAASSAGARPTSRFSASTGTKPFSSASSRAAEYFAAQPPQAASSVSLILPVCVLNVSPPLLRETLGTASRHVHNRRTVLTYSHLLHPNDNGGRSRRCRSGERRSSRKVLLGTTFDSGPKVSFLSPQTSPGVRRTSRTRTGQGRKSAALNSCAMAATFPWRRALVPAQRSSFDSTAVFSSLVDTAPSNFSLILPSRPTRKTHGSDCSPHSRSQGL